MTEKTTLAESLEEYFKEIEELGWMETEFTLDGKVDKITFNMNQWNQIKSEVFKVLEFCKKETEKKLMKIVEKIKKENPYPDDIFQKNEFGKFGRLVWNNCCDKILEELNEI